MQALKHWLSLVKAEYSTGPETISAKVDTDPRKVPIISSPSTEYIITLLEDYDLQNLPIISGKPTKLYSHELCTLFIEYMRSLNLSLLYTHEENYKDIEDLLCDENINRLIDEIKLSNSLVEPPSKLPDEIFKQIFYDSLMACENLPSMEEMIDELEHGPDREEFEETFREIEREYHERLWNKMLPKIPPAAIESFVTRMVGCDLPYNFIERMKLSPLLGLDYIQSQRYSSDEQFGKQE